jgi:flagellar biogenesis protein FliO
MEFLVIPIAWQAQPSDFNQLSWVGDTFASLLQLGLVLAAVLALAFVVLRLLLPRIFGVSSANSGPFEVLARYSLEPRKNLYIIKVGKEMFLIGSSESNIHFLTVLNAAEIGPQLESIRSKSARPQDFGGILKSLQKFQRPKAAPGDKQ